MKTKLLLLITLFFSTYTFAQTLVSYPQRTSEYSFFSSNAGSFDEGADELGMWANGSSPQQIIGWRNFTESGLTGGTTSTMSINDSFTITVSATRAYTQIGIALLSSPTSIVNWNDRHNNYAVQVNLNGPDLGGWSPWQVVSNGGIAVSTSISGDQTNYLDTKIKFTLTGTNTMEVSFNDDVAQTKNITLNNINITGYSIYLSNDWDGDSNQNIYWKPTTEYKYATTLSTSEVSKNSISLNVINNNIEIAGLDINEKFEINIHDFSGKLVKSFNEKSTLDLNNISAGLYILNFKSDNNKTLSKKVIVE